MRERRHRRPLLFGHGAGDVRHDVYVVEYVKHIGLDLPCDEGDYRLWGRKFS